MRRRATLTALTILLFLSLTTSSTFGWGNGGHMAVAMRAWDAMKPADRQAAIALIKQHPRYKDDILANVPKGLSPEDRDLWMFAFYATWPDYISQIRMRLIAPADSRKYPHGPWHVIELPIPLDPAQQQPMQIVAPTGDPFQYHVLDAVPYNVARLSDKNLPASERALALAWVMHMIGDLHEPCHSSSLISKRFPAPDGDHVAVNLKITTSPGHTTGLHQYWDSLYCTKEDLPSLKAWDASILADPTLAPGAMPELNTDTTIASWVNESYLKAQKDVYTPEVRAAVAAQDADPKAPWKPITLSEDYKNHAVPVGRRVGALAGLRLADTLSKIPW